MEKYDIKPALTFNEQLELLSSRGLIIKNKGEALDILKRVNYYKLSGYSLQWRLNDNFHNEICFKDIYDLYIFNKRFSGLIMDLIESVEGIIKTQIAYYIGHNYGPFGYLEPVNFNSIEWHQKFIVLSEKNIQRNRNLPYIKHNLNKYGKLPIWVLVEVLTLSEVSKFYGNMQSGDRTRIAKDVFKITSDKLKNWLEVISIVRNKCAHHGRLYNTYLSSSLNLYRDMQERDIQRRSYFALILIMKKLVLKSEQWDRVITDLENLLDEYKNVVDLNRLGFVQEWKSFL